MDDIQQLKEVMKYRPSAIRNMLFIFLVRFVSLLLSFGFLSFGIFSLWEGSDSFLEQIQLSLFLEDKWVLTAICFIGAILCYFIRYLGRMLLERNEFILAIQEFADALPEEEIGDDN